MAIRKKQTKFTVSALTGVLFLMSHASCIGRAASAKVLEKSIRVGGIERSFLLYTPEGYSGSASVPLVIVLHGAQGSGRQISEFTGFNGFADKKTFIVLYPDAFGGFWNDGRTDEYSPSFTAKIDDVGFISSLIDEMHSHYNIDQGRVYAAGFSNGGMMVFRLGIAIPERLAAVASVAGALPKMLASATPAAAVPVLIINGTADRTVPWRGGRLYSRGRSHGETLSVVDTTLYWAAKNKCSAKTSVTILPTAAKTGRPAFRLMYTCTRPESDVVLVALQGGGHTWPGALQYLTGATGAKRSEGVFNATAYILDFFVRHKRR
jgi:polyhydroxybutyrate depolymerase